MPPPPATEMRPDSPISTGQGWLPSNGSARTCVSTTRKLAPGLGGGGGGGGAGGGVTTLGGGGVAGGGGGVAAGGGGGAWAGGETLEPIGVSVGAESLEVMNSAATAAIAVSNPASPARMPGSVEKKPVLEPSG